MLTIGERLRTERERLRLTQPTLAASGGVTKTSQVNYENDHRVPDAAYLAAVAAEGIDVQYVITGVPAPRMGSDEAELLRRYRAASLDVRRAILAGLGAATVSNEGAPASMTISGGEQGQVFAGDANQDKLTINMGRRQKKGKRE